MNEVLEYATQQLEQWRHLGLSDCLEQVEEHVVSNYPDATAAEWNQVNELLDEYAFQVESEG